PEPREGLPPPRLWLSVPITKIQMKVERTSKQIVRQGRCCAKNSSQRMYRQQPPEGLPQHTIRTRREWCVALRSLHRLALSVPAKASARAPAAGRIAKPTGFRERLRPRPRE